MFCSLIHITQTNHLDWKLKILMIILWSGKCVTIKNIVRSSCLHLLSVAGMFWFILAQTHYAFFTVCWRCWIRHDGFKTALTSDIMVQTSILLFPFHGGWVLYHCATVWIIKLIFKEFWPSMILFYHLGFLPSVIGVGEDSVELALSYL